MYNALNNSIARSGVSGIDPLNVSGLIAAYRVADTTRTGSAVDVWTDLSSNGWDASADGTKDTVVGTAPTEYASGGAVYSPSTAIPFDATAHTQIIVYKDNRITAKNGVIASSNAFLLTNPASTGGGGLTSSGCMQLYNPTIQVGCVRTPNTTSVLTIRYDTGARTVRCNGIQDSGSANSTATTNTFVDIWGYVGGGSFKWNGERVALYVYDRVLTDTEVASIERFHGAAKPATALHVLGDSYVAGTGASTAQESYVRVLEISSNLSLAACGASGATMSAFNSAHFAVAINSSINAGLPTKVVLDLGKNDLAANTSSASLQTTYTSFCNAITATGADLICVSMPPRNAGFSGGADAASYETQRLLFNTWLRSQEGTLFERLADLGADADMGDVADLAGSYYSGDSIHPSSLGHARIASLIQTEIDSL